MITEEERNYMAQKSCCLACETTCQRENVHACFYNANRWRHRARPDKGCWQCRHDF